jgi:hypothetical protein
MNQVTEPVSIPFPTLNPAQTEYLHKLASEMPTKYGIEIVNLIQGLAMEQYKASQSASEVVEEVK